MIIVQDVGVYHEGGGASQYHFNMLKKIRFDGHRHYYHGADFFELFLSVPYKKKLAGFHVPFPAENTWIERLEKLYEHVDMIFIFCSELHDRTADQLRFLDRPKVTIFVNGSIDNFFAAKVYPWMDWFIQTTYFYKELHPEFLATKLHSDHKIKKFDILLGAQREHRDFVYNYIHTNQLLDKNIMTYYHNINTRLDNNSNFIMESDGVKIIPNSKLTHTIDQIEYYGHRLGVSQVVPLSVYNQTFYSLVAETNFSNNFSFYTEKIVKPILAKRLFIVISGQNYLAKLRTLGFKTFDGIIDESYDKQSDNYTRWQMAMTQVEYLCSLENDNIILEQIKEIVNHNYNLMINHDWYEDFSSILNQELRPLLSDMNLRIV